MVKDHYIRLLFIPLLGVLIPFASHIITYELYTVNELLLAHVYTIFTSFSIWTGCNMAHKYIRKNYNTGKTVFQRITIISLVSLIYSAFIGGGLTYLWLMFSKEQFTIDKLISFILYTFLAVTLFTFLYEILFLDTEKETHMKLAGEKDKELLYAETAILRNELDPHFLFNSLTTLNHLIKKDPEMASRYNDNLAQAYKYILKTKNQETVPLVDELHFIEEYFLLLQIRFGNKIQLEISFSNNSHSTKQIIPCALQILVENAVKHNEFTEQKPLFIKIQLFENSLRVINNIMAKPLLIHSTETGLNNLNLRYKLLGKEQIQILKTETTYTVILPLLTTTKPYNHA